MLHQNILELKRSALVIIDMQESFRTKIADFAETAARIAVMVQAARLLNLPILVTEQEHTVVAKMQTSGAIPSSVKMALFELMRDAKHEQFRAIQGLIT